MGIQGLLPLLKSIHKPTHLRNFAGETLGVDAYGWLHRGTVACAIDLAQDRPTRRHIEFVLSRVRMLLYFGVKPYLVFDGDYLPSKAHTEKDRAARRKESRRLGLELLRTGRTSMAQLELQKAVDVTPLMARELIEELKRLGVPYVVAPYEADSELAYLEKKGIISGIISEDSDLLVFGASRLLTKLDQHGECVMIRREDFTACRDISLVGWSDTEFRTMAMLSGCDYLPGVERMGLKTAYRLVRKHRVVDRVVRAIQFEGKMKVPPGYLESFSRAERTFMYQWVYCPDQQCLVNLNPLPSGLDIASMPYIGKCVDAEIASGVASGELDPNTKEKLILKSRLSTSTIARPLQTPDAKQGKPITDFFRSRRTPLAELDPNSFTPSPSQRQLLSSQQNVPWSASVVNESRLQAVMSHPAIPSSAPHPNRRVVSDLWAGGRPRETSKRPRVGEASTLVASTPGSPGFTTSSPFFSKSFPAPSQIGSRKSQDEFELWSDDTFAQAEACASAPIAASETSSNPSPKKRKKLTIFADDSRDGPVASAALHDLRMEVPSIEDTQSTDISAVSFESAITTSTRATSVGDFESRIVSNTVGQATRVDFASFRAKLKVASIPTACESKCAEKPVERSQAGDDQVSTHLHATINRTPPSVTRRNGSLKAAWSDLKITPPVSPRLEVHGSEDMLVPQSSPPAEIEDEGDDVAEQDELSGLRPRLDLSQFIFNIAR